jgi:CSLREA domain-containing protein
MAEDRLRRLLRLTALASALAAIVVTASAPLAAVDGFVVDSEVDAVDAEPGDGNCASAAGECTLRAAIQEANANYAPDLVSIPEGFYQLSLPGTGEDEAASGDLDIVGELVIEGAGTAATVIDGGALDSVFHVRYDGYANVSDLTIQNGLGEDGAGGGLLVQGLALLSDCLLRDNVSEGDGGAIYLSGLLQLDNCELSGNVSAGSGGAVAAIPGQFGDHFFGMQNARFFGNSAGGSGGAIYLQEISVSASLSTFEGNVAAEDGGAISARTADAYLTGVDILGNSAQGDGGGLAGDYAYFSVDGSRVNGNSASRGGGIFATAQYVDAYSSEISGNQASAAGGGAFLQNDDHDEGWFEGYFDDTLIEGNSSGGPGGGIYFAGDYLDTYGVSLVGNSASAGGGAYVDRGDMAFWEATISQNTADSSGGGLASFGFIDLWASAVDGNSAVQGGGIDNLGILFVDQSTLSNNVASDDGGGLRSLNYFTAISSTFSGNRAQRGAAIANDLTGELVAVTVADNAAAQGPIASLAGTSELTARLSLFVENQGPCAGELLSNGYNLSDDGACGLEGDLDLVLPGPHVGPLADNGGPTLTHFPSAGSAVVDAAPLDVCAFEDQRWQPRPLGHGCDIGAVEFVPPASPLFEGWNLIDPWLGPTLLEPYGIMGWMISLMIEGDGWVSIAHYEDGGWRQTFADPPLPQFNTLEEIRPGLAYWLFMEHEATLDFEITEEDYDELPPPPATTTPPPFTGTPGTPGPTRTPRPLPTGTSEAVPAD